MSLIGQFLYDNCAYGARLSYGTLSFFVGVSAYLIGFRQIELARTIHCIVQSGDLVAENMRRKSNQLFCGFFIGICIYYIGFLSMTLLPTDGSLIVQYMMANYIFNLFFTLSGLLIYIYTITMLRRSIAQCASFQFETRGTYLICGIYAFTASM